MKIAFVSTRGIPNNYGGLEEFAEHVSVKLVERGHEVIVYNPHFHPFRESHFHGVRVKKIFSPEPRIGTAGNFIYDFLSLRDALKERCDAILVCGYTTSSISYLILSFRKTKLITNIDGLEWKRSKYSPLIQKLTRWFEKIAVEKSHAVISDNRGIEDYVTEHYQRRSFFIPYAAELLQNPDEQILAEYGLEKFGYHILIGRLEPENNIEMILDGVAQSRSEIKTHIFAGTQTRFAKYLMKKYEGNKKIVFRGWLSGQETLNQLRHFARIYFHGHSVGGTNPSLLEAMAGGAMIAAHDNAFNRYVLGNDAFYFQNARQVSEYIDRQETDFNLRSRMIENNIQKIRSFYNWDHITTLYEKMFMETAGSSSG